MAKKKNFIDPEVFKGTLMEIKTVDGKQYQDVLTIYGDMSRLVVSWLAKTDYEILQRLYNEYGWGGNANVRAIHEAAKKWLEIYHPAKC